MTQVQDRSTGGAGDRSSEFLDVVIVGAGLSGIDAAYRVAERNPGIRYALLEQRDRIGGTWDLFRYPGIRSDSDIYTLSYPFRPWDGEKSIADGADIRQYIADAADEYGITDKIRFGVSVRSADFDTTTDEWTVVTEVGGQTQTVRCRFLFLCTGYYDYSGGYTPEFPGIDDFAGTVVHPQKWPEDLDYTGKNVVVIGSGATAITLIPSMSRDAAKVTMLQRSPTYITILPSKDKIALALRKRLPASLAHRIVRFKNAGIALAFYLYCRKYPDSARARLRGLAKRVLPEDYDVDTHFNPTYNPWDQRLCVIPDGDLYRAIKKGKADIVTDTIASFDETGVRLSSGDHLDADIVVTATGLQLLVFGGIRLSIDGEEMKPNEHVLYRGRMLDGVPNFAWTFGYTNASWTLRADLTSKAVAELIAYMGENGYTHAFPDRGDAPLPEEPMVDLKSGYIARSVGTMPRSAPEQPWRVRANVVLDTIDEKRGKVTDAMTFGRVRQTADV